MPQYNGVWTLEQQAQAQSNQQWVTDPNFKNTTLLLQADNAANGATNNTFLDSSTNSFVVTRNGNTTQGSFTPFSQAPGYWGNYFNGSSTISAASNSALNILAYDTFECWVNMSVLGTNDLVAGRDGNYWLGYNHTSIGGVANKFVFSIWNGSAWQAVSSTTSPVVGTWYHIVGVKDNTTLRFYVNGVQESTSTFSGSPVTTGVFYVASNNNTENLEGYVSNLRLITGATNAVFPYSGLTTGASFTPPTSPLTAVSSTQLLTCQSNRFVDNGTANGGSGFTITTSGTPSVQAFAPFAPALQWTPDVVGGSGYFDGSGDSLSLSSTSLNLGSSDFTIETWVYATTTERDCIIGSIADANGLSAWMLMINEAGYPYRFYCRYNGGSTLNYVVGSGNFPVNQWTHFAVTRNGANTRIFINGVQIGGTNTSLSTFSIDNATAPYYFGRTTDDTANFTGYLSGTRVVVGTALYTSDFAPPTSPPTAVANTALLTNFTNAGIYDGTMNTSWQTVNNTQVSTSNVKVGSGSIYFDGTASQRLLPSQNYPQLIFGTADFTLECWLYIVGKNATTIAGIWDQRPGVNGTYINWVVDFGGYGAGSATAPKLVLYADSATFISSNVISMGTWNHVALCRANGITRMFINGVLASTPTADTKNYLGGGSAGNYRPSIGCTDGGDSLYGFIDDFRASRFARYIANFTPPQQALPRQ